MEDKGFDEGWGRRGAVFDGAGRERWAPESSGRPSPPRAPACHGASSAVRTAPAGVQTRGGTPQCRLYGRSERVAPARHDMLTRSSTLVCVGSTASDRSSCKAISGVHVSLVCASACSGSVDKVRRARRGHGCQSVIGGDLRGRVDLSGTDTSGSCAHKEGVRGLRQHAAVPLLPSPRHSFDH